MTTPTFSAPGIALGTASGIAPPIATSGIALHDFTIPNLTRRFSAHDFHLPHSLAQFCRFANHLRAAARCHQR